MIGVINDADELKSFRNRLADTAEQLENDLRRTDDAIDTVAEGWKDGQFKKFQENFTEDKEVITPLCTDIKDFEEVLYDLEKKIRKYLGE